MTNQRDYLSIKTIDSITKKKFITEFYQKQKPVLIKNYASNWPAIKNGQKSILLIL
jgi:hypothetical protein